MNSSYPLQRVFAVAALASCSLFLIGCGGEREFDRPETFRVIGTALVDGAPIKEPKMLVIQAVRPEAKVVDGAKMVSGSANAEPDGTFELSSFTKGDGLEPGKYTLTFTSRQLSLFSGKYEGDSFGGKYANPDTSEVSFEVTGKDAVTDLGEINLTTE